MREEPDGMSVGVEPLEPQSEEALAAVGRDLIEIEVTRVSAASYV